MQLPSVVVDVTNSPIALGRVERPQPTHRRLSFVFLLHSGGHFRASISPIRQTFNSTSIYAVYHASGMILHTHRWLSTVCYSRWCDSLSVHLIAHYRQMTSSGITVIGREASAGGRGRLCTNCWQYLGSVRCVTCAALLCGPCVVETHGRDLTKRQHTLRIHNRSAHKDNDSHQPQYIKSSVLYGNKDGTGSTKHTANNPVSIPFALPPPRIELPPLLPIPQTEFIPSQFRCPLHTNETVAYCCPGTQCLLHTLCDSCLATPGPHTEHFHLPDDTENAAKGKPPPLSLADGCKKATGVLRQLLQSIETTLIKLNNRKRIQQKKHLQMHIKISSQAHRLPEESKVTQEAMVQSYYLLFNDLCTMQEHGAPELRNLCLMYDRSQRELLRTRTELDELLDLGQCHHCAGVIRYRQMSKAVMGILDDRPLPENPPGISRRPLNEVTAAAGKLKTLLQRFPSIELPLPNTLLTSRQTPNNNQRVHGEQHTWGTYEGGDAVAVENGNYFVRVKTPSSRGDWKEGKMIITKQQFRIHGASQQDMIVPLRADDWIFHEFSAPHASPLATMALRENVHGIECLRLNKRRPNGVVDYLLIGFNTKQDVDECSKLIFSA